MSKRSNKTAKTAPTTGRVSGCLPASRKGGNMASAQWPGSRILARGVEVPNDTWKSRINNNDLVIGPTGAGKTRCYVKPNLLQMNESAIVVDTKGSLRRELGPALVEGGYRVIDIDFTDMADSHGYNPFDSIRIDPKSGKPREQDIMRIADALVPIENAKEPFWDFAAKNLLSCYIGLTLERFPEKDWHLGSVAELLSYARARSSSNDPQGATERLLDEVAEENPTSYTARKWGSFRSTTGADRMYASILGIVSEKIDPFTFDGALAMFQAHDRIDFANLGREKTAVFVTVSDTDRSMDRVVGLFYAQALQELCRFADCECAGAALPVPVRLYLDDFATNCRIADFDKIISVIRSRNIAVSVVLQSITQLDTLYGHASSMTIVNGCDHWLYLGGQDIETARIIAEKAGKAMENILDMAVDDMWLFERGRRARQAKLYNLERHERYSILPEARQLQELAPECSL